MFKALLAAQLKSFFGSFVKGKKDQKNSKGAKIALIVLFAVLGAYFMFSLFVVFSSFSLEAKESGQNASVFTLGIMISMGFCLMGSIFTTKSQIFEAKDNELLLSMPIPENYIFLARIIVLSIFNYILELIVMLPCMIAYNMLIGIGPLGALYCLVIMIVSPLASLAISTVIAWLISLITSRLKNKNLVSSVLFVLVFGAYMLFTMTIGSTDSEVTSVDLAPFSKIFFFSYGGIAIANENILYLLAFVGISLVPILIAYFALKCTFVSIITTKVEGPKAEYKGNKEKSSSVFSALYKKEVRRLFSSSTYLLNSSMGCIMSVILAIAMIVTNPLESITGMEELNMGEGFFVVICAAISSFVGALNNITAPSISLEDKNLWILQMAPVSPRDVLMAKLLCHISIVAPFTLISSVLMGIAFRLDVIGVIMVALFAVIMVVFSGYLGLFLGLKFPIFGWDNEQVAVKTGFAVFGSIFGPVLLNIITTIIGILLSPMPYLAVGVMMVPAIALTVLLHLYLVKRGVKDFEKLQH